MKKGLVVAVCALALFAAAPRTGAQLAAPTAAGVSLGAVYYTVPDVAAHRKLWVEGLGAKPVTVGKTEMLKIPGAFIVLSQGQPAAGDGLVNHLGIWGKDLETTRTKLAALGAMAQPKAQFITLPDNLRLEFIDDANGPEAPSAHHIHYFIPAAADANAAQAWYMKQFGASQNSRRNGAVPSALLTAPERWISVDFTKNGNPTPNKGKVLDRFALEVKGIDAFVKKLEADGVKVSKAVSTNGDGLKTALIVDAVGNEVELIEGLAGK